MLNKIIFFVMISVLLLAACSPTINEPVDVPISDIIGPVQDLPGEVDRMPCTTIYDYETNAQTDQYQAVVDQLPSVTEDDWIQGDPVAPVTIIEYSDFQCPACQNFSSYLKALQDAFPNSFRIVFRHLPLASIHPNAYIAAMAAEAAGRQDMFWEMHDRLFLLTQEWSPLSEVDFIEWAVSQAEIMTLDVDQFQADIKDQDFRAALEAATDELLEMGVHYTPFVVINGRIFRENQPDMLKLVGIHEFGGFEECPPWVIDQAEVYTARLDTSAGVIDIELFPSTAPIAVNSFVFLAQNGWYEDVYFHRVLEGFVAQAGDPSGLGVIGPGYTFINETENDLTFDRPGLLGMANAGVDTNGSQFFITFDAASNLDGGYTIFGQVKEESLDVLDQIGRRDPQTAVGFEDATIIYSIEILQ